MQSAVGVSVAYLRLRRCLTTLPEEASTGATPQRRLAKEASLPNLSGLSPRDDQERRGVVRTDSRKGDQLGSGLRYQTMKLRIQLGDLLRERPVPSGHRT